MTGVVRSWHRDRRFGKVTGADKHAYFVFFLDLVDVLELGVGQRVVFRPTWTGEGLRAVNVRLREPVSPLTQPEET